MIAFPVYVSNLNQQSTNTKIPTSSNRMVHWLLLSESMWIVLWITSRNSRSQVLSSPVSVCLSVTVPVGVQPDRQPSSRQQRLVRATGAAVGVGVGLMENCIPGTGGRLMVFTGGPCTTGPGAVVGLALEDSIRTHRVTHCSLQPIC